MKGVEGNTKRRGRSKIFGTEINGDEKKKNTVTEIIYQLSEEAWVYM